MKTNRDFTTNSGFYDTFFELLPFYRTNIEAFNYLNNEVGWIIGKKLYKDYKEFRGKMYS
ncbi:hypothetical protein GCM10023314_11710 [Algibacter agarivorans]|uniref:Uncharacterized protein n=1 Tax=Algibacter agarivorans TaxID=1109741 RepID=A0ABP9GFP9_9FLAO